MNPLEMLCELHNNYDPIHLHDALQHLEDAVKAKPDMTIREFLVLWLDQTIEQEKNHPIDYNKE